MFKYLKIYLILSLICVLVTNIFPQIISTKLTQGREKRSVIQKRKLFNKDILFYIQFLNYTPILQTLGYITNNTCLRFHYNGFNVEGLNGFNYKKTHGPCTAPFGPKENAPRHENTIYLNRNCANDLGMIQHLTAKMLGLLYTHNRRDRDKYITVNERNIRPKYKNLFDKYSKFYADTYGLSYDFGSIMHIKKEEFSEYGTYAVTPKDSNYTFMLGQRRFFSFSDIKIINMRYCQDTCSFFNIDYCQNGGYRNPRNCISCVCPHGLTGELCEEPITSLRNCGPSILNATSELQKIHAERNTFCSYIITAPPNEKINITIDEAEVNFVDPCDYKSAIEVRYKYDKSTTGLCLCGYVTNLTLISDNDQVIIVYNGLSRNSLLKASYKTLSKGNKENQREIKITTKSYTEVTISTSNSTTNVITGITAKSQISRRPRNSTRRRSSSAKPKKNNQQPIPII